MAVGWLRTVLYLVRWKAKGDIDQDVCGSPIHRHRFPPPALRLPVRQRHRGRDHLELWRIARRTAFSREPPRPGCGRDAAANRTELASRRAVTIRRACLTMSECSPTASA